jgi:exopolysaccharide biosynthesis polyprenyl glycosylphosphotransferase
VSTTLAQPVGPIPPLPPTFGLRYLAPDRQSGEKWGDPCERHIRTADVIASGPRPVAVDAQHAVEATTSTLLRTKVISFQLHGWTARLLLADAVATAAAAGLVLLARFGLSAADVNGFSYDLLAVILVPAWLTAMALAGTYDGHYIPAGAEQYRRILNGGVWLLAAMAFASFALRADVSRTFVLASVPLTTLFTVGERFILRKWLQHRFARDWSAHRVIAIGSASEVVDLAMHMHRASHAGFRVVAALTPGEAGPPALPDGMPWAGGDLREVVQWAHHFGVDTLAVVDSQVLGRGGLRRLSWELEGTAIQLVVAPGMTDLAGPRIRMRPIDGLPLLHIEKPQFTGARRALKGAIDRVAASLLLIVLSPVMVGIGLAVLATSKGPIIFRQRRVGQNGRQFWLLKFRTMSRRAEDARASVAHLNEQDGILFKIRRDPRLTWLGRFLRRFSLDELPQLVNVVHGEMSLVGPRPPLPSEVSKYGDDVHRRLLVKPGLTGLWQVSGRSELSWEESVRLDLYYVDHWSVGLDLVLLVKTVMTVIRGRGAY